MKSTPAQLLGEFNEHPDSSFVRQPTVEALYSVSASTLYRLVKRGNIPAPRKLSTRVAAWHVGELRSDLGKKASQ